jgi:hypothetical protein
MNAKRRPKAAQAAGVADSKVTHQPPHLRWSIAEVLAQLDRGETIVVSVRAPHRALVNELVRADRLTYIGRKTAGYRGGLVFAESKWANPFQVGRDGDRPTVIEKYREHLTSRQDLMDSLPELAGRALGCWCAPLACHGDVLVELVKAVTT